MREVPSPFGFAETLQRLESGMAGAGMTVFARIDQAAAAAGVGLAMPPTTILVYGNPRGGTPIMLATPAAALDLPLRVLVREAPEGVLVGFHPITELLTAAGVDPAMAARLEAAQGLLLKVLVP